MQYSQSFLTLNTEWEVSKYRVYGKIRTTKNSVFGHISHSVKVTQPVLFFWVNLVFISSPFWVFISSPIGFVDASPVEKLITPENFGQFYISSLNQAFPTGILRQGVRDKICLKFRDRFFTSPTILGIVSKTSISCTIR